MKEGVIEHPAKYSDELMPFLVAALKGARNVLDPFGGSGKIFSIENQLPGTEIFAIEIEHEWASMNPRTLLGDALDLSRWPDGFFASVCTSPTYGNRLADHHNARDNTKRPTYTHTLGRKLHPNNSGQLHWGPKYRAFHMLAWLEAKRVLEPGGIFVLNIKDHYKTKKKGQPAERQNVTAWHRAALEFLGFTFIKEDQVPVSGNGFGKNGNVRMPYESILIFLKEKP